MTARNFLSFAFAASVLCTWGAPTWHVAGGTPRFRTFVAELAGGADVRTYGHPHEVDFASVSSNDVCFLMPAYGRGERTYPDWDIAGGRKLQRAMCSGAGIYLENLVTPDYAQDGLHADLSGFQVVGRPRALHQEYLLFGDELVQARGFSYLPGHVRNGRILARVTDGVGTHRESVVGKVHHPVLVSVGGVPRVMSALIELSAFDSRFERPYSAWERIFCDVFAPVTGCDRARIAAAFRKVWPDAVGLSHGKDVATCVRRALEWHAKSGVMPVPDGSGGVFEMIRSNDLGVRAAYRGDTSLMTAALFAKAGEKYGNAKWKATGRRLADAAFACDMQDASGFFRWYAGGYSAYYSDSARCARACVELHRMTGERRYFEAARKFADLVMAKTEERKLFCGGPSGDVDLRTGGPLWGEADWQDNPSFYCDLVTFLCELGEDRYAARAADIADRILEKFPAVKPFGYSDNLTYARCLAMLAAVQSATERDYSAKINFILAFMSKLTTPCGAIAESPLRLEACHTEGGVAMGDGSDRIADVLYCNAQTLAATTRLLSIPDGRGRAVDREKVRALDAGLRRFFLDVQISSPDPRLDGGWMRAFDTALGEWYGLDKDMDWGAYCIMGGWVMASVPMALMADGIE